MDRSQEQVVLFLRDKIQTTLTKRLSFTAGEGMHASWNKEMEFLSHRRSKLIASDIDDDVKTGALTARVSVHGTVAPRDRCGRACWDGKWRQPLSWWPPVPVCAHRRACTWPAGRRVRPQELCW